MEQTFSPTRAPLEAAAFWERRTQRVRLLVNTAWFLEVARPILFLASLVATAAILLGRRLEWELPLLDVLGAGLAVVAVALSFARARRRFISPGAARTEIESRLQLHSRLSAASAGIGPWPEVARWRPALWRWHWHRLLVLPLCSVALVLAAFYLPMLVSIPPRPAPIVKPPALEKIESLLEKLAQAPQLDQATIETLRQEAEQLARQDPADWYSHASLEAADHLQAKMQAGLKTLGDQASKLENLLGQNPGEAGAAWNDQLQSALSALQGNVPGLHQELARALAGLEPSRFKTLSPEQVEKLRDQLKEVMKKAGGQDGRGGEKQGDQGPGGRGGATEEGEGLGNGGVNEGPGTGPLKLGSRPVKLGSKELEPVQNDDFRQAAVGDALGMSAGQHDVEKQEHRAAEGGAAVAGEGASAVWRQQNVTPEERKRLQEFFR